MTDSVFCPPPSSLLPKSSSAAPDAARAAPSGAARVPAWRDKAMRMFLGRSLLAPVVAWRWHGRLNELHRRHDAPPPPARGLSKPLRSYLDSTWGPRRRLEALLLGGLGFWWAWVDRERLAWHDRASGTRIIRLPKKA